MCGVRPLPFGVPVPPSADWLDPAKAGTPNFPSVRAGADARARIGESGFGSPQAIDRLWEPFLNGIHSVWGPFKPALTPAQAAEILKQAENLEKYGLLAPSGVEAPVDKDW